MQTPERQRSPAATAAQVALALMLGGALVGCGRSGAPTADTAASTAAGGASAEAGGSSSPGDEGASDADLVSAVNPGPPGEAKPITVKFRIEARPVVGMPVKVLLVLTPSDQAMIEHIHVSLAPGDGLLMQSAASFDLTDPKAGMPLNREVTVVPQQTGVLDLGATLLLQMDKASEARTYSIPLIAADNSSNP